MVSHLSVVSPSIVKSAVTFVVIMAVVMGTLGISSFRSPGGADDLPSQATLTIRNGSVQVTTADAAYPGVNGMTLSPGTMITTSADGSALLTFFDGSELELEGGTTVQITDVAIGENNAISITLTQLAGNTWSHVTKMIDRYSKYEIHTPSAVALVRGTYFLTQVTPSGKTRVETSEGLVSVEAEGEEVYVPVGKKTIVKPGATPTVPVLMNVPDEDAPEVPRTSAVSATQGAVPQGALLGLEVPDDGQPNAGNGQDKTNNGQGQSNADRGKDKSNNGQGQSNADSGNDKTNNGQGQSNADTGNDKTNNDQGQSNADTGQDKSNNGQGNGKGDTDPSVEAKSQTPGEEPEGVITTDDKEKPDNNGNGNGKKDKT